MAHIYKLETGRWQARYQAPDGRRRTKNFQRKIDAERWLNSVETDKLRGEWVDPRLGKTRVEDWAERWLEAVSPSLRPKTVASYESLLRSRILPVFGSRALSSLRPMDVQQWVASMVEEGVSPSRIRQAHVVLSLALQAAVRDGLIARDVTNKIKRPKLERQEASYFDQATVDRIAQAVDSPQDLVVRMLGATGLRWAELAGLRRSSVDLLRNRIRVTQTLSEVGGGLVRGPTKSYMARTVPVPPSLAAELRAHIEVTPGSMDAPLFTGPGGGPIRYSNFYNRVWRPALRGLELPVVGLHVLRHSAAAALISAGASPKAVQTILGHASAAFTLTVYGHMFDEDLDALAVALDARRGVSLRSAEVLQRYSGSGTDVRPAEK
jgi:integrase